MYQRIRPGPRQFCFLTRPVYTVRSCYHLAQAQSWMTTPCWLPATAYSIYLQLHSILEAIPPPTTWGCTIPWLQGPTYNGIHRERSFIYTILEWHFFIQLRYQLYSNYVLYKLKLDKSQKYILTLILLTWRNWWAPNNASKWQVGFNSAFKGLKCNIKYTILKSSLSTFDSDGKILQ
jgi:hypothetical protein